MGDEISDDRIRHLASDFDRERVERIVEEVTH